MSKSFHYTRAQFEAEYKDDDACLAALFKLRFKLPCCPNCGVVAAQFYRVQGRRCFACMHCRYQIYPAAGTIMHRSTQPLKNWFVIMYSFSINKNMVATKEIERELGISYKAALRMTHSIRKALKQDPQFLQGIVEADEAYIGGRRRSSNRFSNKVPLLGAVQRGGGVRVRVSDVASAKRVTDFLLDTVRPGSTLNTDESPLYHRASRLYKRISVKHSAYEFVRGDDFTNTIEGFWGLFKPSLSGTFRSVSKKHLQLYVNEAVWKYNRRQERNLFHLLLDAVVLPIIARR